jgi:hypothetical protein
MEVAEQIYREGAFSHSVAKLLLDAPLQQDVPIGSPVTGVAFSSQVGIVNGIAREDWLKGDSEVLVEYAVGADSVYVSWFLSFM